MLVASSVENVWFDLYPNPSKPHLTHALWIFCGDRGMRVWMPLFPRDQQGDQKSRAFISRRIMLPFELSSIYPIGNNNIVFSTYFCYLNFLIIIKQTIRNKNKKT